MNVELGGRLVRGKVLLLSQRRIADLVAYSVAYEFEDTFAAVTCAQRIDATDLPALEFSRRAYRLARFFGGGQFPADGRQRSFFFSQWDGVKEDLRRRLAKTPAALMRPFLTITSDPIAEVVRQLFDRGVELLAEGRASKKPARRAR